MGRRLVAAMVALLVVPLIAAGSAEARSRDRRRGDDRYERRGRVEFRGRMDRGDRSSRYFHSRLQEDGRFYRVDTDRRSNFGHRDRYNSDHDRFSYRDRRYVSQHSGYYPDYAPRPVYVTPRPVYVAPRPVYVRPRHVYAPAPVVLYPHPTYVSGPQFILRGRAPIGSRVMVEVTAVFGGSVLHPVTYDSYVDYHGGFAVPVHTAHPGYQHRVKVWSVMDGVHSAPAGVVVYRR